MSSTKQNLTAGDDVEVGSSAGDTIPGRNCSDTILTLLRDDTLSRGSGLATECVGRGDREGVGGVAVGCEGALGRCHVVLDQLRALIVLSISGRAPVRAGLGSYGHGRC